MSKAVSVTFLQSSRLVTEGKGLFTGLQFAADTDGATVTVYDGLDENSARTMFAVEGLENAPNELSLSNPVEFHNGLYVDLDDNVDSVSIMFSPERSYSAGRELEAYVAEIINAVEG